jgi:WD40 repeat protein
MVRTFASRGHTHNVFNVGVSADRFVVSGADDGVVKVWSPVTGLLLKTLRGCSGAGLFLFVDVFTF